MATVSDITITPFSGMNHIDALLDKGPDWNFLTSTPANTIRYTFSISSGTEDDTTGQQSFNVSQQAAARSAFAYLEQVTGIKFVETAIGTNAEIHLANMDIAGSSTTGLCSWTASYSYGSGNVLVNYTADAYVYLDNVEWRAQNQNLTPGTSGYQTLLHELGHALGLGHPFHESGEEEHVHLPIGQDNTSNTLMSYTSSAVKYSTFSPYDIAALNWLYGGDGLGGALGVNSATGAVYLTGSASADTLTGTAFDDTLQGNGGNDVINGGNGNDTAIFVGDRSAYTISGNADGSLTVASALEGTDTLIGVEQMRFSGNVTVQRAEIIDTTPPAVPVFVVQKNNAGYLSTGRTPVLTGQVEANALIRVYSGEQVIAESRADGTGIFRIVTGAFPDGLNYSVRLTATDASGNVSAFSAPVSFNVDATPPAAPTTSASMATGGNQPVFEGRAEAGMTIQLVRATDATEIGRTVVKADGTWKVDSPAMPNGTYIIGTAAIDIADNARSADTYLEFTINSALNQAGNALKNSFTLGAGNNAVDGMGGIDTVVYGGAAADYTVARGIWGHLVTAKSGNEGMDTLINVERIQFRDGWKAIDIDGIAGQVYRLYEAVFGRPSDSTGMGYWIDRMEKGSSLLQVAKEFITNQPEFNALYGANPSNADFLTKLYLNILDRAPDAAGYEYWVGRIVDSSREQILMEFSEGFENQAQVIGSISGGINYTPWTGA